MVLKRRYKRVINDDIIEALTMTTYNFRFNQMLVITVDLIVGVIAKQAPL